MPRDKILHIRLTDEEYDQIMKYAASKGVSASEVLRDFIKTLVVKGGKK